MKRPDNMSFEEFKEFRKAAHIELKKRLQGTFKPSKPGRIKQRLGFRDRLKQLKFERDFLVKMLDDDEDTPKEAA